MPQVDSWVHSRVRMDWLALVPAMAYICWNKHSPSLPSSFSDPGTIHMPFPLQTADSGLWVTAAKRNNCFFYLSVAMGYRNNCKASFPSFSTKVMGGWMWTKLSFLTWETELNMRHTSLWFHSVYKALCTKCKSNRELQFHSLKEQNSIIKMQAFILFLPVLRFWSSLLP